MRNSSAVYAPNSDTLVLSLATLGDATELSSIYLGDRNKTKLIAISLLKQGNLNENPWAM
jgi:hypothetical protein